MGERTRDAIQRRAHFVKQAIDAGYFNAKTDEQRSAVVRALRHEKTASLLGPLSLLTTVGLGIFALSVNAMSRFAGVLGTTVGALTATNAKDVALEEDLQALSELKRRERRLRRQAVSDIITQELGRDATVRPLKVEV